MRSDYLIITPDLSLMTSDCLLKESVEVGRSDWSGEVISFSNPLNTDPHFLLCSMRLGLFKCSKKIALSRIITTADSQNPFFTRDRKTIAESFEDTTKGRERTTFPMISQAMIIV